MKKFEKKTKKNKKKTLQNTRKTKNTNIIFKKYKSNYINNALTLRVFERASCRIGEPNSFSILQISFLSEKGES